MEKEEKELQETFEMACYDLKIVPSIPSLEAIPETYRTEVLGFYKNLVISDALLLKMDGLQKQWLE